MTDQLGSPTNLLKTENLQNELNLKFVRMKKKEDMVNQAMFTIGKYKGWCKNCGKYRHGSSQ